MDNRFTKKRVANMLSYDWGKMVLVILAITLVWSLAFTVGAPRASTGQVFTLFIRGEFKSAKSSAEILNEASKKGTFSYDVLDFSSRDLDERTYGQVMMSVASVQEGDIMIVSDSPEEQKDNKSIFRNLVDFYKMYSIDELIESAENYCMHSLDGCEPFVYKGAGEKYLINEKGIKDYFAKRMAKDPRFRKKDSERYKQGELDEIKRIKDLWNNAQMLKTCLENHPELRRNYTRFQQAMAVNPDEYKDPEYSNLPEKTYGLNLGFLTGGETDIKELFAFSTYDDKGTVTNITADGVILAVFDYTSYQRDLQYETLGFINYIIETYSNFFDVSIPNLIP